MISPGTRVGKYQIKRLLGQGGFGMVFAAQDVALDRECAMKFLLPEHTARQEILQRFLKEARSAAKIKHGGIVTVYECGVVEGAGPGLDGMAYIAMELLEGESLAERVRRGPLPFDQATDIARQVASALEAAHAAGIIHRDLKPDNIFLVPDAATTLGERAKVLDFGIAKLADEVGGGGAKTSTHMIFGTPKYMSPEQCKSTAKVDERSDIYALGCILFEMVCGRAPFDGDAGELIAMQQLMAPPAPRSLRPDLPPALDAAISAMLAKQPTLRPSTMADVAAQLGARSTTPASAQIAPTLAPDALTNPPAPTPAPMTPSEPAPTPIPAPPPQAPSEPPPPFPRVAPTTPNASPARSKAPIFAIAGVVVVGGIIAFAATRGGDKTTAATGSGSPTIGSGSNTARETKPEREAVQVAPSTDNATRYYDLHREYYPKAMALVREQKCDEWNALVAEVRAKSSQLASEIENGGCGNGARSVKRPSDTKTYAMPLPVGAGPTTKVTIIVGSEYQCAFCLKVKPTLEELAAKYKDDLQILHRPNIVHPIAFPSSVAACAAAKQGAFAAYDKLLWERSLPTRTYDPMPDGHTPCFRTPKHCPVLLGYANELALDIPRFKTGMESCVEPVSAAVRDWHRFYASGAPSFFINGRLMMGARPADSFIPVIDEELAKANKRIAEGTKPEAYYRTWVLDSGLPFLAPDDVQAIPARPPSPPSPGTTKTTPEALVVSKADWHYTGGDVVYCIGGANTRCRTKPTGLRGWHRHTLLSKGGQCFECWDAEDSDCDVAAGKLGFKVADTGDRLECETARVGTPSLSPDALVFGIGRVPR